MDSLTHLALGHAMGVFAVGSTPAVQTAAYWGALVGNSLPDIDVSVGYLLGRGWAFHRKFTHTVPGVLLLSLSAAGIITWVVPGSAFAVTLAWTLAGCVVHVFLDCLNLFGTRPFWPFSSQNLAFGVLFIMDPLMLTTLGLGSIAHLMGWIAPALLQVLYLTMWLYVGFRWLLHSRLRRRIGGERSSIVPFLLGWRYFREAGGRLEYGKVEPLTGKLRPMETVECAGGPVVDASRQIPAVANFLARARYPVARVEQIGEQYRITWEDFFLRLRGRRGGIEVTLNPNLTAAD